MAQGRAETTTARAISVPVLAGATALALVGWAVTARRLAAVQRALADERTDPITSLPTRRAWYEQARARITAPKGEWWLLLADVDGLKPINDSLGHDAGHAVLRALATRMRTALGGRLLPGRLGGDEFGLLLHQPQQADLARLDRALRAPVTVRIAGKDTWVPVSVSLGAVAVPPGGADLSALLTRADHRMYREKSARRSRGRRSSDLPPGQTGELVPDPAPHRGGVVCRADTTRHPAHRS